jgi:phenylacetic acid degradation protein paaN
MPLTEKHKTILEEAHKANRSRAFHAAYPEHPKAYDKEKAEAGKEAFDLQWHKPFDRLLQSGETKRVGEEVSPYTLEPLGITYPYFHTTALIDNAEATIPAWRDALSEERAEVLVDSLERISQNFFEIGYATQHTTGQSFMMSFQASGPHANDRGLEAVSMAYDELNRFADEVRWEKPMGKTTLRMKKTFKAVPKGISLVVGCSTFPVWNSMAAIYSSLMTGNPVIVKPHAQAVYPIALVVAEIQKTLEAQGYNPLTIQLAPDTLDEPITRALVEHDAVQLIDYTGGSHFGDYIEQVPGKTTFTEKSGVNSILMHSCEDLKAVCDNIASSVSLYSGQMCTAPQNIFIPEEGIQVGERIAPYEEVVAQLKASMSGLAHHPKMGPGMLGAINQKATLERIESAKALGGEILLDSEQIEQPDFPNARTYSPAMIQFTGADKQHFARELFGPVVLVVRTTAFDESLRLAAELAREEGAITCSAYCTDEEVKRQIAETMERSFAPVSFNMLGMAMVNQNAAFSDFHLTGGNPAGNASFTSPAYIINRFVWVGHKEVINE